MPTRLLREGIINSDRINQLSTDEEVFYRRLMSKVDDHGLFDARSSMLRSQLFPLRLDKVSESNCEQWLTACINAKLILLYQSHGKPFLKMLDTKWKARSEPKYDPPINGCKQLKTPVTLDVVVDVVRSRLIEVVDVVVSDPVDNLPKPQGQAKVKTDLDTVQGKTYWQWAQELGISLSGKGAAQVKLEIEQALKQRT